MSTTTILFFIIFLMQIVSACKQGQNKGMYDSSQLQSIYFKAFELALHMLDATLGCIQAAGASRKVEGLIHHIQGLLHHKLSDLHRKPAILRIVLAQAFVGRKELHPATHVLHYEQNTLWQVGCQLPFLEPASNRRVIGRPNSAHLR
jgi:hypothetical protein